MNESYLFFFTSAGLALLVGSWIWLVTVAWRQFPAWGLAVLAFPPAGLLFAYAHFPVARRPILLALVGLVAAAGPPIVNRLLPLDLGPRNALVNNERHITLTGWDQQDYGILRSFTDASVVQMANADVKDETLRELAGFERLRELDLSNTGVTDAGLPQLATLGALQRLRLANTKITDAGFAKYLAPHPQLVELDLRGTAVTNETIATWRAAKPGRRVLR